MTLATEPLPPIRPSGPAAPDARRYVVVVLEGASDRPLTEFGDRTPLAIAKTPALDRCAVQGRVGCAELLPIPGRKELPQVLPERAFAQLLGVPARRVPGRGVLEALGRAVSDEAAQAVLGKTYVKVDPLNVVDGRVRSVGVGSLSVAELEALAQSSADAMTLPHLRIDRVFKDGALLVDQAGRDPIEVVSRDPWSLVAERFKKQAPMGGALGEAMHDFLLASQSALDGHEVNATRGELNQSVVSHLWPWGADRINGFLDWSTMTGFPGTVLSRSPWAQGLARWLGLKPVALSEIAPMSEVLEAIQVATEETPVTVLHLTDPAAASFNGSAAEKEACLKQLDHALIGPLWDWLQAQYEQPRLMVTPGIGALTGEGVYLPDPVPFVISGYRVRSVVPRRMTEDDAERVDLKIERGPELLEYFLFSGTRH